MFRAFLPVCLNISGYKILMVGAGKAAQQKLRHLSGLDCRISIVAEDVLPSIRKVAKAKKFPLCVRRFKDSDISGYDLIYACTDNMSVNRRIAFLAKQKNILCNIVGNNTLSDFISLATYRNKRYLVSVSTFGQNPAMSVQLRDKIKKFLIK